MASERIQRMFNRLTKQERVVFDSVYSALTNSGSIRVDDEMRKSLKDKVADISNTDTMRVNIKDMLTSDILGPVLGYSLSVVAEQAVEPNLVISRLYHKIGGGSNMPTTFKIYMPGQLTVTEGSNTNPSLPAPGPNPTFHQIGGQVTLEARRAEVFFQVQEETINFNQWDIVAYWMKEAGRALAREKEKRAYAAFQENGVTLFDNLAKDQAIFHKWLSGRDIEGRQNGTLSPRDFFKAYAHMITEDFNPDTVLIHPYAWQMFLFSPLLREIMIQGGKVSPNYMPQNINYGKRFEPFGALGSKNIYGTNEPSPDDWAKIGASLVATSNSPWVLNPLNTEITYKPDWMPGGIKFIVSKYVAWSPTAADYLSSRSMDTYPVSDDDNIWNSKAGDYYGIMADGSPAASTSDPAVVYAPTDAPVTDMILLDSSATGFLYQKQPVMPVKWTDYITDMQNMKLREMYGFAVAWQGRGVGQFRGIPIDEQYVADNVNQVSLSVIQ